LFIRQYRRYVYGMTIKAISRYLQAELQIEHIEIYYCFKLEKGILGYPCKIDKDLHLQDANNDLKRFKLC
jgi:hypothetical protein